MVLYEYRCRTCDDVFDQRRAMRDANAPVTCPQGHPDTVRLLSTFARTKAGVGAAMPSAGGCCGGACGCG